MANPNRYPLLHAGLVFCVLTVSSIAESSNCADSLKLNRENRGEEVVATCVITSVDVACSFLTETLYIQVDGRNVSALAREELNSTAVTFTLHKQHSNASVECLAEGDSLTRTTPAVPELPTKPHSISCVSSNMQTMNCTWQPNEDNTNYTLWFCKFSFFPGCKKDEECPFYYRNGCYWDKDSRPRDRFFRLQVRAERVHAGTVYSDIVTVETKKIAKLNSVHNLRAESIGPTSFTVKWEDPIPEHWIEMIRYRMKLTSQWEVTPKEWFKNSNSNSIERPLHGLIPHTRYTVNVTCIMPDTYQAHPGDEYFFSHPQVKTVITDSDVPNAAPVVTPGGFSVSDSTVEIFWQPVPEYKHQGRLLETRVQKFTRLDPTEMPSCDGDPEEIAVTPDKFSTTITVETNYTTDFCVYIVNDKGRNSTLQLQPIRKSSIGRPFPKFYVVGDTSGVTIHLLEDNNATELTVYWCTGNNGRCVNNYFSWSPLTATVTKLTEVNKHDAVIAVSAEFMDFSGSKVSSGMKVAGAIYLAGEDIKMPTNLWVDESLSKPGTLVLKWDKILYTETAYIDHFNFSYCRKDLCDETRDTERVAGTKQAHTVLGLDADQTYVFKVKSVGDGISSEYTEPVEGLVRRAGLPQKYIILISVLGVIGAVLVVAGVYTVVRCCQKRVQAFRRPITIVEVPDMTEMYTEENGNKTTSADPYVDIDLGSDQTQHWQTGKMDSPASKDHTTQTPVVSESHLPSNNGKAHCNPPELNNLLCKTDQGDSGMSVFNSSGQPLLVR